MIKTKYITWKDYYFTFRRGGLSSYSTVLKMLFKSFIGMYLGFRFFNMKKSLPKLDMKQVKSIVVYFPETSGIGDLIMASCFFEKLREVCISSEIIVLAKTNIFIDPKNINSFISIGGKTSQEQKNLISTLKPDLLLLPEKSIKGSLLALSCKATHVLGYVNSYYLKSNFDTPSLEFNPAKDHYYLKSFRLLQSLIGENMFLGFKYHPNIDFVPTEMNLLQKPYVVFVPSVLWSTRTINYEQACLVVKEILDNGFIVMLCGGGESKDRINKLALDFKDKPDLIRCEHDISLHTFVSHVKHAAGVVCGDSGPMHIALGFNKKVFSYWGATNPKLRLPEIGDLSSDYVFEESKCAVQNCYNMEHAPLCKKCLRLENVESLQYKLSQFLKRCA